MVLVAAPAYLQERGRPSSPHDLKEHACLFETHLSQLGEWRLSPDVTVQVNRGPLASNSVRVAREASLENLGVSYLPRFLVSDDIDHGRLEVLLPDIVTETIPLYLMFPKGNYSLAKVRAFVDFLTAELRDGAPDAAATGMALASAY
jgi:DNA-binding transcriptional LysR family regulator